MRSWLLSSLFAFPWLPPCTPTTLAGSHSQGWPCWHSSSESVPYLLQKQLQLDCKRLALHHIPFTCLLSVQQRGECGALFFPVTFCFVPGTHAAFSEKRPSDNCSSLLHPPSCKSCLLSLGKLTFVGFCLFADLRCLPDEHFHRKCSQHMHTFGNKGSPSNFGKKHHEMWLHLYLHSATRIWTHFLPIFFPASNERN